MNTTSFFNLYDLNELELKRVFSQNNKLNIDINVEVYQDYIANGFRLDFDLNYIHRFIFDYEGEELDLSSNIKVNGYRLVQDKIELIINDIKLILLPCEVKVLKNI